MHCIKPSQAALYRWTAVLMQPFFIVIGAITVFTFLGNYIGTYEPLCTGRIIDSLTAKDIPLFWKMIAAVTAIQLVGLAFSLISSWIQYLLQKKITGYTESRLFLTVLHTPPSAAANRGKILNVFLSDLAAVTGIYTQQLPALIISAGTMAVIGFRLVRIDGFFFCLTAIFSIIPVFLAHYFGQKQAAVTEVQRRQQDQYTAFIDEAVTGLHEIKNYSAARFFKKRFQQLLTAIFLYLKKSTFLDMRASAASFTANFVTNMALFIIVGYSVLTGKNTIGTIVSALMYSQQFRSLVSSCAETYKGMVIALVSARRVKDCFDVRTGVNGIAVKQMKTAQKELRIADLSFSYTGERFLFLHLNAVFTFPRLYAVKGENGCGKTTLLNIIAGTLRPVHQEQAQAGSGTYGMPQGSGSITFAGFGSTAVAYVSQNPFIFSDTVVHNLTLGKSVGEAELTAALEKTRLTQVIDALPEGLETKLGGNGYTLSQGQRQRLALARCLLHGSDIILFDEAENALDAESADALERILSELKTSKLIIMVTHGSRYDRIADETLRLDAPAE